MTLLLLLLPLRLAVLAYGGLASGGSSNLLWQCLCFCCLFI
jgi:hypothetical protein